MKHSATEEAGEGGTKASTGAQAGASRGQSYRKGLGGRKHAIRGHRYYLIKDLPMRGLRPLETSPKPPAGRHRERV
jgi:hypothetical protein